MVIQSISSEDMSIVADMRKNVLVVNVDGPITPALVVKTLKLVHPLVTRLHESGLAWGTIVRVSKNASFFPEAIEEFLYLSNSEAYKNRQALAFVIHKDVPDAVTSVPRMKMLYENKVGFMMEVFSDYADAFEWISKELD